MFCSWVSCVAYLAFAVGSGGVAVLALPLVLDDDAPDGWGDSSSQDAGAGGGGPEL